MHLIVYVSEHMPMSGQSAESVLTEIVDQAKRNNPDLGITGVLFYENGHFIQAIEGEKSVVQATFEKIFHDSRHERVQKLIDKPVASRAFSDWSMDAFLIDAPILVDSVTIGSLCTIYSQCFELDSRSLIEFFKKMIDEVDTFKIVSEQ